MRGERGSDWFNKLDSEVSEGTETRRRGKKRILKKAAKLVPLRVFRPAEGFLRSEVIKLLSVARRACGQGVWPGENEVVVVIDM